MEYPKDEWKDIVYMYLLAAYKEMGDYVVPAVVAHQIARDMSTPPDLEGVKEAFGQLESEELIRRSGSGYAPIGISQQFRLQMEMEEVVPFTGDPLIDAGGHLDRLWVGEFKDLRKPSRTKLGYYPVLPMPERHWTGLALEDE